MRTMQIGHVTLWSDEDETIWKTMSFAVPDDLQRMIRGEISYPLYASLKHMRDVDNKRARLYLGEPIKGA